MDVQEWDNYSKIQMRKDIVMDKETKNQDFIMDSIDSEITHSFRFIEDEQLQDMNTTSLSNDAASAMDRSMVPNTRYLF